MFYGCNHDYPKLPDTDEFHEAEMRHLLGLDWVQKEIPCVELADLLY